MPMQSVPTTTKVVSLKPTHGEVNSIQHYVIKFASALLPVGDFLRVFRFQPQINPTATIVESGVKHHTLTQNLRYLHGSIWFCLTNLYMMPATFNRPFPHSLFDSKIICIATFYYWHR